MTKSMERKNGTATVDKAESNEKFAASDEPNPAYVQTKVGFTKNLGDYESLRVDVSISVPVKATEKAIRRGFDKVSEMTEELLALEIENAQGD